MPEIVTHDTQTAEPGEFAAYLQAHGTTPPAAPVTAEPAPEPVAEATPAPKEDGFDDPETHERIEKPTRGDKRIKRLWTEREAERARNAKLEAELADLKASLAARDAAAPARADLDAASGTTAAPDDALIAAAQARIRPKPNRADIGTKYPTYEDYVEDCSIWGGELATAKFQIQAEQEQATAAITAQQRTFEASCAEARAAHEDFDQVTRADLPINEAIWNAVVSAPQAVAGHALYWLGTHPDECRRIAALPPGPALVAMGEVFATVRAGRTTPAPANPEPGTSQAPPPLEPVRQRAVSISRASDIAATGGRFVDFFDTRNAETKRRY